MAKRLGDIPGTKVEGRERSTGDVGKINDNGRVILSMSVQKDRFEKKGFYLIHVHETKPTVFIRFFADPEDATYTDKRPLKLHRFQETTAYVELKPALRNHGLQAKKGEVKMEWKENLEALEIDLTGCVTKYVEEEKSPKKSKAPKKSS